MEMSGLQIFKYMPAAKKLPNGNCKKCGFPTCMAFSLKLAKQQVKIEKCPYAPEELKNIYSQSIKHAQKTVSVGDLKIGGENVLYRHEKTFINPTALAVIVDCNQPDYKEKIEQINNFGVNVLNEKIGVDLIITKNGYCNSEKNISYDDFLNLEIDIIKEENFKTTKEYLINARTKAIIEKDEKYSKPTCVILKNDDIDSQCTRAAYYICKYANMLVFEEFDPSMIASVISLRHSIFTDPQKTLQVDSGLYEFNNPDKNSIIFMTTNFALTFFAVSNELESLNTPCYLIVIPAQGMSVLTAWSAETFNPEIVAKTLKDLNIKDKINTRKIIIPGLLGNIKDELHDANPDFEFIEGTKQASEIGDFVANLS